MGISHSNIRIIGGAVYSFQSAATPSPGGSLLFNGINSDLTIPGSSDWALGNNDFTIEWFQYQISGGGGMAQRPFSIGGYPSASVAVSIEGESAFYFWAGGIRLSASLSGFLNTWTHFAVVNHNGSLAAYQNGAPVATGSFSGNITDSSTPLSIGSEYDTGSDSVTFFNGNITNFRWTKGLARYTSPFTRPSAPLTADSNTKLLLLATNSGSFLTDSSSNNYIVTNESPASTTWSSDSPFA